MVDPLSEVVALLQPGAPFSKLVVASAPWAVRRAEMGQPFYFAVLEGSCRLTIDGEAGQAGQGRAETITLHEGDFVLIPSSHGFATSSPDRMPPRVGERVDTRIAPMAGGARVGNPESPVDVRMLVGNCVFGSPDADLLVSLLPRWVHVQGERRLSTLVELLADESRAARPAREMVVTRLLEVLLVEALRSSASVAGAPGLVQGLADARLSMALRCMHERPDEPWTVETLAREAAMSRSAFFDRFSRLVGMPPMQYLLSWRMAMAKQMLRRRDLTTAEIAERVGYGSVSTFGVAFHRHVGVPPGRYARAASVTATPR